MRMMIPGRGLFTGGKMRSEDRWRFWRECLGRGLGRWLRRWGRLSGELDVFHEAHGCEYNGNFIYRVFLHRACVDVLLTDFQTDRSA